MLFILLTISLTQKCHAAIPKFKTLPTASITLQPSVQDLPKRTIVIDPGHGGRDSGAQTDCGMQEMYLNC